MAVSEAARKYVELAPRPPDGPLCLDDLIPGDGPLELDVGFGRGLSLFQRAEEAPESRIIGIEIKSKWACKVDQQVRRRGLSKVRVLCGDAREILARAGPAGSIDTIALHFPDPWWKKRHMKRRILEDRFIAAVRELLRPGGLLFVQTDVEDRARLYVERIRETGGFAFATESGFVEENPLRARSNRERRALLDGLPIWRIAARRNDRFPPRPSSP